MQKITVQELKNAIAIRTNAQIVDVRTLGEYINLRIKEALFLPLSYVNQFDVPLKKSCDIYAISNKGQRAMAFCQKLDTLGYRTFYLEGGLEAWCKQNYPVERISGAWSFKRLIQASLRYCGSQSSQNSQPFVNIKNIRIKIPGSFELKYYFHQIINTAQFFERMGINVKFVFKINHNYFENSILEVSEKHQPKHFVTIPFTKSQERIFLYHPQRLSTKYGYSVISKLSIKQGIQKQADEWSRMNLKGDWVGVHFRGTDLLAIGRDDYLEMDVYIAYLKEVIDKHYSIFACSDQAQFIEQMQLAFPHRVFSTNIQRSYDYLVGLHMNPKYRGFQQRKDALIDLLILSKANLIYQTGGGFSSLTRFLNPSIKIISTRKSNRMRQHFPQNFLTTPKAHLLKK